MFVGGIEEETERNENYATNQEKEWLMLKILCVVAFFLVLSVPCAAETTRITCLGVDVDSGEKTEWEIAWHDSHREVIYVDGAPIPRTMGEQEYTLENFGNALISWCYQRPSGSGKVCSTIDRTSGSYERTFERLDKRRVIARGSCRKSSEGNKF